MKRIVILANSDIGLYKFRRELIQQLIDQGNRVYIALPDGGFIKQMELMGCKFINTYVDRRGLSLRRDLRLLWSYQKILNEIKPDLVITYTIKPNLYGGMTCRWKRIPYAVNITGLGTAFQKNGLLKQFIIMLYKIALKKAKVVFFENSGNLQELLTFKVLDHEQACLLNGAGVSLEEYQYYKYPPANQIRFLFIGRVMKEKGIDELVEVAKRLKKTYDNVFFDIVGPMEDDYQKKMDNLVSEKIVEYYGYQEDVRPFIRKCHCFVLPSYHEGMANTLLEAGAVGRPLITSDIPGCREAVNDKKSGFLVKVKEEECLYEKITRFIDIPYNEREKMGIASCEIIRKKFDKKNVVSMTIGSLDI